MPNSWRGSSLFLGTAGGPDSVNVVLTTPAVPGSYTPYAAGNIGTTFEYQDKAYTVVVLDSGATSANPVGAPAVNQALFWKNKANRIVTNDFRQCITPTVPSVSQAGVLRNTPTTIGSGGNMICMLIKGSAIPVVAGTCAIGPVMVDTTASTARVITATSTTQPFGQATTADSAGLVTVNVDVPQLP
jgi:hypothetical protein